jgi:hypothetical protein
VKNEAVPVSIRGQKYDALDTSLVFIQLNPTLVAQAEVMTIPNSFMYREASTEANLQYDKTLQIPAGGYILRFWPALPVRFSSVETLILHQEIGAPNSTGFVLSLWNYASEAWEPVEDLSQEAIRLPSPEQYVGPGGELRLKLDGNSQDHVTLDRLDFELTVSQ